jgi:hypothetical protein
MEGSWESSHLKGLRDASVPTEILRPAMQNAGTQDDRLNRRPRPPSPAAEPASLASFAPKKSRLR